MTKPMNNYNLKNQVISYKFVDYIPDLLERGIVYVSLQFNTIAHSCCCGCGEEVVTPISPVDWTLIFDGETISLYPSIGNWSFPCRSHYWIRNNRVIWASPFSQEEINNNRIQDNLSREAYYKNKLSHNIKEKKAGVEIKNESLIIILWRKFRKKLFNKKNNNF